MMRVQAQHQWHHAKLLPAPPLKQQLLPLLLRCQRQRGS
jgi:hypothetical protein